MLNFNGDLPIGSLPANVYQELINELDTNSGWHILGQYVAEELDCFGNDSSWIRSLEQKSPKFELHAEKLLFELHTKMCTVEILACLLERCGLLKALSILSLPEPLVILKQPNANLTCNEIEVALGQQLRLICKAGGLPPPNYLWYQGNIPLSKHVTRQLNIKIRNVNQEDNYRCKVYQSTRDGCVMNETFSESVSIKIKPTCVVIEEQPLPTVYIKEGELLKLSCKANSHPRPQFQWFRDNTKLDEQTSNILRINRFTNKDEGKYYCHVFNEISDAYSQRSYVMVDLPRQKAVAKIALLIANEDYQHHTKLGTPKADVARIAQMLEDIGFIVICLINISLIEMNNAINVFSEALLEGVYGLFYFAGHGFRMQESYMLPVDAPEVYLRNDAVCESQLLSVILKNDPTLFVTILDVCQIVPSKEINPVIHEEVPLVNEYKGQKNLRNLIQAYSTSSHRPSYEQNGNNYGLYAKHLSKFIDRDLPINKLFEEVGKSIDTWLKGTARNQIPMFSSTITKPFRLIDSTSAKKLPAAISSINQSISFPNSIIDISFEKCEMKGKVLISAFMKPYLNIVKIRVLDSEAFDVNFYNSIPSERNNLYQNLEKRECWIHNPQLSKAPLVICFLKDGVPIGASLLNVMKFVPDLVHRIK